MQTAENKRPRNSGIELLKLIAMILIVVTHSIPTYGENCPLSLEQATADVQLFVILLMRYFGHIGNAIFFTASAWFMLDSDRTSGQKILRIMGDTFVLSILSLAANFACGYEMSLRSIVSQLFPVTFAHTWFITAYLLLYAMHCLLNRLLRSLNKNAHLLLCVVLIFLYVLVPMVVLERFWNTNLIGVTVLYVLVAYFKFHIPNTYRKKRVCIGMLAVGLIGFVLSLFCLNVLGLRFSVLAGQMLKWNIFTSPMALLIAFGSFGLAKEKQFVNRTVNYLSSIAILIYLIHESTFSINLRIDLFAYIKETFTFDLLLLWIVLYAVVLLVISILLSLIYKYTLQKLVRMICDKLSVWIGRIYGFFAEKLLKLD